MINHGPHFESDERCNLKIRQRVEVFFCTEVAVGNAVAAVDNKRFLNMQFCEDFGALI